MLASFSTLYNCNGHCENESANLLETLFLCCEGGLTEGSGGALGLVTGFEGVLPLEAVIGRVGALSVINLGELEVCV